MSLNEIKKLISEYPLMKDREIITKIIECEKLTERELSRAFHMSLPLFTLILLNKRFERNKQLSEEEWATNKVKKLDHIGTVKNLEILPLIDFQSEGDLLTEEGVSYFIKADDLGILFDAGLNDKQKHPSPLLNNMKALGVTVEDFNYIVISHLHGDHVGGNQWVQKRTFSLSGTQLNLEHVKAFTPVPMSHPTATTKHVKGPE
ncbi:MAG: MBL fold metallo-hydrolase, partial [Candidatus Thorarchaeota archaeon]